MSIHIKAESPVDLWEQSLVALSKTTETSGKLFKEQSAMLEMLNVKPKNCYSELFPITTRDMEVINNYLVTGENEQAVVHEWTKLYRKRLVNEKINQIANVITYLKNKPRGLRAQMSVWDQAEDMFDGIGPCFQVAWFKVGEDGRLDAHIHMRACDCYGKLLMNVNEFVALQNYIAKEIGVDSGQYVQFVDSLHFNAKDKLVVGDLVKKMVRL